MTVQDHRYHRPAPGVDLQGRLSPFWRWLSELVWRLEHGFERARADARPEEDTRVRIFLILIVFSCVFAGLALGPPTGPCWPRPAPAGPAPALTPWCAAT